MEVDDLPPGFRFAPTDEELLGFYLRRKAAGLQLPPEIACGIPTLDLFVPGAAPPWLIHPAALFSAPPSLSCYGIAAPRVAADWFYCFTRTTRRGSGSCRATASGTWHANGGGKRVKAHGQGTVGCRSAFAFKIAAGGGTGADKWVSTNWVMNEFRIHGRKGAPEKKHGDGSNSEPEEEEVVLCRIRCTKSSMQPEEGVLGEPPQKRQRTGFVEQVLAAPVHLDQESPWSESFGQQVFAAPAGLLDWPEFSSLQGTSEVSGGADMGNAEQWIDEHEYLARSQVEMLGHPAIPRVDSGEEPWMTSWAMEAAPIQGIDLGVLGGPAPLHGFLESTAFHSCCLQLQEEGPLTQSQQVGLFQPAAVPEGEEDPWGVIDWGFLESGHLPSLLNVKNLS